MTPVKTPVKIFLKIAFLTDASLLRVLINALSAKDIIIAKSVIGIRKFIGDKVMAHRGDNGSSNKRTKRT